MLLHNGRLYFESDWEVGLWCLDADSGMTLWTNRYGAGEWAGNGPTLSPDGTTIYAHGDDGKFVAIDATSGSTLWSQQFADGNGNLDPIVDAAGNIYCGFQGVVSDAEPDILVKFAPDGSNLWRMSFGTNVWSHGGYALSPDGARIYCSVDLPPSTGLVAVDTASGAVLWSSACGGTGGGCVVGAPGDVIIGVFDIGGGVAAARAVRDEGSSATILWTIPLSPTIPGGDGRRSSWSWPTLLENGDVIVESSYGVIARITVPEPTFIIGVSLMGLCGLRRRR
jgi:outer membrane protein assembly factor BamB